MVKPFNPRNRARRAPVVLPPDHIVKLSALWKAFEDSGAVSAYIAYRLFLSRIVRVPVKDLGGVEANTMA